MTVSEEFSSNPYHGRGIMIGKTLNGKAFFAYFIMGRSANSRNRIFKTDGDKIKAAAFDESKLEDPSLIIYNAVNVLKNDDKIRTIVTNGDQTDTVYDLVKKGYTFEQSLRGRRYEPDSPNFTPRISAMITTEKGKDKFKFNMSILKKGNSEDEHDETACVRNTFTYSYPVSGTARFIHTYREEKDGLLLPFVGEPKELKINASTVDEIAEEIWGTLNKGNRISLAVRVIEPLSGEYMQKIINGNTVV